MALCFFEELEEPNSEKQLKGVRGVVAMTDSEVCLMDGAVGIVPTQHFLKFPISEIESVSGSTDQVQIRHQGKLIVLVAFDWEDFRASSPLNDHLYSSLIAVHVPKHEPQELYSWSMLSSVSRGVYNGHLQDHFPSRDKGHQLLDFSREQSARDREFEENNRR